jgi:hypothetical protein
MLGGHREGVSNVGRTSRALLMGAANLILNCFDPMSRNVFARTSILTQDCDNPLLEFERVGERQRRDKDRYLRDSP